MNLILMRKGYTPAIIKIESRRNYLDTLQKADTGNLEPFVLFVTMSLVETQNMLIKEIKQLIT